jgi:CRISPR-associated protein Cst1
LKNLNDDISDYINKINAQSDTKKMINDIVNKICKYKNEYVYRKSIGSLFSKNCIYQNLINPNTFDDTNKFINTFSTKTFLKNANSRKVCSFCTRDEFETEVINAQHMNILFPVYNAFPNAYWNNNEKSVMQICSFCKFIIIHHHLPWIKTNNGDIFINAPSFKIMWYLNKFAKDVVDKNESYNLRKILGISYLELAQKTALTLGAWSLMNVEMVIKKGSDVDYYSLPYNISVILLQKDIASLINSTNEPLILELILEGKIEALLELEYHIQRCLITKNQNQKYVKLIKNKSNMKSLSQVLPILYAKIDKLLKKGGV